MTLIPVDSSALAKLMSTSIAPVFLITGVTAILNTMSLRYGRIIDRIRQILREGPKLYLKETGAEYMHRELRSLYQRARLLRLAIILEGLSIFGIALTIVLLFVSLNIQLNTYYVPQFLFLMSLVLAIAGTILFVKDFAVSLALIEMDMQLRSDVEIQDVKTESVFKMLD
ncbi:MAG: DUF2721 domain-containing protein [Oligoflexales bacterium]